MTLLQGPDVYCSIYRSHYLGVRLSKLHKAASRRTFPRRSGPTGAFYGYPTDIESLSFDYRRSKSVLIC